jgi:lysozyme
MYLDRITNQLVRHEGLQLKVYTCPANKLTIGVGRNLEDRGITEKEAFYLLHDDIVQTHNELSCKYPFYDTLDDTRQEVLINMAFQLGLNGLSKFKKTLEYIEKGMYKSASEEMLNSNWAKQTPKRAYELSNLMKGEIK